MRASGNSSQEEERMEDLKISFLQEVQDVQKEIRSLELDLEIVAKDAGIQLGIEQLITQQVDSITIAGNDEDALEPVLKKAMDAGIKVLSMDSAVNANSRMVYVNQANPESIGRTLVDAIAEMMDNEGEFAILSATSQAANQNIWIEYMQETLEEEQYSNIDLVSVVYGDDLRDKSTYPKLIGSPPSHNGHQCRQDYLYNTPAHFPEQLSCLHHFSHLLHHCP